MEDLDQSNVTAAPLVFWTNSQQAQDLRRVGNMIEFGLESVSYWAIELLQCYFSSRLKLIVGRKTTFWATKKWDFLSEQAKEPVVCSPFPLLQEGTPVRPCLKI